MDLPTNTFDPSKPTPSAINLDTTQPEQPISLDSGSTSYLLSPDQVQDRAFKASYGLDGTSAAQPQNVLESAIGNGQEQDARQAASTQLNQDVSQQRQANITQRLRYGALPQADMEKYFQQTKDQMFDPRTVFEMRFGQAYAGMLDTYASKLDDSNFWNVAKQMSDTDAQKQFGSITAAYHDYFLHRLQGTQSLINNQSGVGYTADFLKMAFPVLNPYLELKMRSNVEGVSFWDGLLGSNLDEQRMALLRMPYNKGTQAFDQIMDRIEKDNPQAAATFAASMLGQSTSDKNLNNLNTVGNLSDIPAVIKIASLPFRSVTVINAARRAVADQIIAKSMNPEMTKADIMASVGDLRGAAVEKANDTVVAKIQGSMDATKQALDEVPRFLQTDKANIAKDPGNLTQTETNALLDQYNKSESTILSTLANTLRPSRLPLADATRQVLDSIATATFDRYPGMANAIIHLSDPVLEPIANTYNITARIGKGAGVLFDTEEEAINYARYHGLRLNLNEDQLANLDARIADLKANIKEGLGAKDADTAGLNHYFGLEKQVKDLEDLKANASLPGAKLGEVQGPRYYDKATREKIQNVRDQLNGIDPQTADVNGLNKYHDLKDQLASLEQQPAVVGQQGLGHYIEVTAPVDETSRVVRDFIYDPTRGSSATPVHSRLVDMLLSHVRTAEDTFSAEHTAMRKAALYPHAELIKIAQQEWDYIKKVGGLRGKIFSRQEMKDFKDLLQFAQDGGVDFKSPKDLQNFYLFRNNRMPTFAEQQAYFAVRRWNEYDRVLREVATVRNKARLGAETHIVYFKDAEGNKVASAPFDGVVRKDLPGSTKGNVLVMGDDVNSSRVRNLGKIRRSKKESEALDGLIKSGEYKLIQPYDLKDTPFKDMGVPDGDKTISYVLVKGGNSETAPLTYKQVNRTFGGHWAYDYDHYVKQAIVKNETVDGVKTSRYQGDKTIVAAQSKAMGQDFVDKMNEVRLLIADKRWDEAKAIISKHLPFTSDDVLKKYKTGVFDTSEPFHVVPNNRSIREIDQNLRDRIDKSTHFYDDTKTSLARHYDVEFTGQRDSEGFGELAATGTAGQPVYSFKPAQKIDPIQIMTRGMGSIVKSSLMDDYKTYAIESWLREAAPHISNSFATDSELRSSPYAFFRSIERGAFNNNTPPEVIQRLMANKFKINQLLGTPSLWDTFLHSISSDMHDWAFNKFGASAASTLVPSWMLSTLRDPFKFIRGVTFDAYLGFAYIPQLFVQAWGYSNVFAMAPRYATSAMYAQLLHTYAAVNHSPEILAHLDKLASKMSIPGIPAWKPGEWMEARQSLMRTGFGNVGGEYGPISNLKYASPIQTGMGSFLNWGRKPFQMGEGAVRIGAWYTAFKEFRDINPACAISKADLQKILDKADLYYGNMSSASHSAANVGLLSLPLQFYTYTKHLAEIFWSGTRLGDTVAERNLGRARILAVNSALFGVPMGFGVTGLPAADWLRREMMAPADNDSYLNPMRYIRKATGFDEPYTSTAATQVGGADNWVKHFFMEGIPAAMTTLMTGKTYNIGDRYGNQGWTAARDALAGDAPFWKTIFGASGSMGMNWWHDKDGFVQAVSAIATGDTQTYPVTFNDLVDLFKVIQTINKVWGLYVALNYGRWISRNGATVLDDVSPLNAIFMTLTGLQPQEQQDLQRQSSNIKNHEDMVKYADKKINEEWNYGSTAASKQDYEQAKKYFARAIGWTIAFNLNDDEVAQALSRAVKATDTNLIESTAWRSLLKAPKGQEKQYQQLFSTIHNYQQGQR